MSDASMNIDPMRWRALAFIATAQLMIVLDSSIVNIALPSASRALHISPNSQQWVVTAYTLAFGGLLLLGGRVADYVGRRKVFLIGLLGFAFSSALGGLAQNGAMLFSSRALQGAFAAFMAPAALSIISTTFTDGHERAKAFGVYGAISGGGAAVGLLAGGLLTEFANWRWCLLVNVPIALVTFAGALKYVHESTSKDGTSYDLPGAILITGGLTSLVYGFTLAELHGWSSWSTIGFIAGGCVAIAAFLAYERTAENPLLPLRILLERNRGGSFLSAFLIGTGMTGMFLFLTLYFQDVLGYSALKSGGAFLPFSMCVIGFAGLSSKLLPKFGPRPLMGTGLTSAAIGLAFLSTVNEHSAYLVHILPSCVLIAGGMGLSFVALSSTALFGVHHHDAGVASATLNASQQIGGALGLSLLYTLALNASTSFAKGHGIAAIAPRPGERPSPAYLDLVSRATVHGFSVGFVSGAIALAIAAIVAVTFVTKDAGKISAADELVMAGF